MAHDAVNASGPAVGRRDFLKAAGAGLAAVVGLPGAGALAAAPEARPNIIVLVFDALSAMHVSSMGYPRVTTPNLDALGERSTVFHKHYSASNFTTAGTASMLSGMQPWRHRGFNPGGLVRRDLSHLNPFGLLGGNYRRLAFSQNIWADRLLRQSRRDIDRLLDPRAYSLLAREGAATAVDTDPIDTSLAMQEFLFPMQGDAMPGASILTYAHKRAVLERSGGPSSTRYPKGLPEVINPGYWIPYRNEDVFAGLRSELEALDASQQPYFAYLHLWSPHFPYRPRNDYRQRFRDEFEPAEKPTPHLRDALSPDYLLNLRTLYDRQVAQVDAELGQLLAALGAAGILERSYLVLTSDHGELFERGFYGHGFRHLYEPVLRIPLLVHAPGQTSRVDVRTPTSNIDLLPTLLEFAGGRGHPDLDGRLLPGFGGVEDLDRPIFALNADTNSAYAPISRASIAMRKGSLKLIAYIGYRDLDQVFELYDLEEDPDERFDLADKDSRMVGLLKDELLETLDAENRKFER